jgi:cellulose synthase/poly-beta-1,6-N-acetylglucosamine synthase-like glycosyltransferase
LFLHGFCPSIYCAIQKAAIAIVTMGSEMAQFIGILFGGEKGLTGGASIQRKVGVYVISNMARPWHCCWSFSFILTRIAAFLNKK